MFKKIDDLIADYDRGREDEAKEAYQEQISKLQALSKQAQLSKDPDVRSQFMQDMLVITERMQTLAYIFCQVHHDKIDDYAGKCPDFPSFAPGRSSFEPPEPTYDDLIKWLEDRFPWTLPFGRRHTKTER